MNEPKKEHISALAAIIIGGICIAFLVTLQIMKLCRG